MKKEFEEIKICDACNSKDVKHFITSPDRNYQTGTFSYIQCTKCKLVWLSPRPKQSIIYNFYPKVYIAYQPPKKPSNFQKIFRGYLKKSWLSKIFIKDELFFERKKGKLLDVGTGNGAYLDILKEWGYDVYGVEIDKKSASDANKRGLNVEVGDLFSARQKVNSFDYVRFSHVMEHVPSPKNTLKETHRILKKGGKVYIYIPNINSLMFKVFRSFWYPLEPPRHLFHYNETNIKKLLRDTGFKRIDIKYYQSPYNLIRSFMYFLRFKNVEKRAGILVYPLTLLLRLLDIFKASDTLIIKAVKE